MYTQKITLPNGGCKPRSNAKYAFAALLIWGVCAWCNQVGFAADNLNATDWVKANMPPLVELYKHLHQTPELSSQEKETSARMAKELEDIGAKVTTNIGGYGVVGVLENGPGKVLLLRSDTDALPVAEQTGLPYASKVHTEDKHGATVGVMHACGHDVHMTNLVGVARYLASHRDEWSGTVLFVFQPAEEVGGGADAMIQDGIFKRFPRPDYAVAFHDSADVPTGEMNYFPGYALANVDSVDITIKGRGGHGASPESTIDPIVIAAKLVLDLQTIVSREVKPIDPAVVTVGSIHAGTKHNIISDECKLQLTLRSLTPQVRKQLQDAVRRKAFAAAASAGAPDPTVEISEGTPALFNDPELTKRLATALKKHFGDDKIKEGEPVMGGEDFGRFGSTGVPICMLRLGAVNQKRLDEFATKHIPPSSLHSPLYYPDIEETLTMGVPSMVVCVTDLLPKKQAPSLAIMHSHRRKMWFTGLIVGYIALLAAVVGSMLWERHAVLEEFGTPEALANWQSWRGDVQQTQSDPGPVQRQVPKSNEPPALVLMRDYFNVSMFGATFFTSILYWIMAWFITGALGGSSET